MGNFWVTFQTGLSLFLSLSLSLSLADTHLHPELVARLYLANRVPGLMATAGSKLHVKLFVKRPLSVPRLCALC